MPKKTEKTSGKEYTIGFGRPPQSTQWKKGESGNRKGRPKGRKNQATIYSEVMNRLITIHEDGKVKKITVHEAIIRRLAADAVKGGIKAIAMALSAQPEMERKAMQVRSTYYPRHDCRGGCRSICQDVDVGKRMMPTPICMSQVAAV